MKIESLVKNLVRNLSQTDLDKIIVAFNKKKQAVPKYTYSKITFNDLKTLFNITRNIDQKPFNVWFNNDIEITDNDRVFFKQLIEDNYFLIESYKEEDLKVKFITPVLNRVRFIDINLPFRDFYEETLSYKTDRFILTGETDFLVSKGLEYAEKPYFFIQEFKKSIKNDDPRPQLLAELISGLELNAFSLIRGAYIVGSIWNFVILEKTAENSYQYFISTNFDATKIDDLIAIYKNLCFVKNDIIEIMS